MSGATTARDAAAHRPRIVPLPDGVPRPRWSVMIPTYNCARYLRTTLERVLAQAPAPDEMQIEVVDDHSTADDPERLVAEVGGGRVEFFRQTRNVGHTRNFNCCLKRARGELVHLLHGDDYVLHGFYATMQRPFESDPAVGAAFCRNVYMDEAGHWQTIVPLLQPTSGVIPGWLETIALGQRLQPPAIVVRRAAYERIGGFDQRIATYGEDWEMYVRIAAAYPVWYEPETLAVYRIHTSSLSGRSMRSGANMRDIMTAIEINEAVLPRDRARHLTLAARKTNALGALRRGTRVLRTGDLRTPLAQMREALRMSRTPRVAAASARLLARWSLAAAAELLRRRTGGS